MSREGVTVGAGGGIQPRMRVLIEWLNRNGFRTTDSGDGVTNVEAGMEGALAFPHVVMVVHPITMAKMADRLLRWLESEGCAIIGVPDRWIEATYNPVDKTATLMLAGVTDESFCGKAAALRASRPDAGEGPGK